MSAESRITVGLLHPGEMGAAVGTTVVAGGMPCLWASAARSAATRARAREVGLEDGGTLEAVVRASRVIPSVVPPPGAADPAAGASGRGVGAEDGVRRLEQGRSGPPGRDPRLRARRGRGRGSPRRVEDLEARPSGELRASDPRQRAQSLALRGRDGRDRSVARRGGRSEEHTSELQSPCNLVCRLLLEKKKNAEQRSNAYNERSEERHTTKTT